MSNDSKPAFGVNQRCEDGHRLKWIRVRHVMSQDAMAVSVGCSVSSIRNYETGLRSIPRDIHYQVLQEFGFDVFSETAITDYCLSEIEENCAPEKAETPNLMSFRASHQTYLKEKFSPAKQRFIKGADQLYWGALIALFYRLFLPNLIELPNWANHSPEMSVFIGLLVLVMTGLVQIYLIFDFFKWRSAR